MLEQIFHYAGIPTLIGLVALYFAYRVMILGDIKSIRGKGKPEPKDKEGYCRDAGRLLIFFAVGTFLMGVLESINAFVAARLLEWVLVLVFLATDILNTVCVSCPV